MTTDHTNDGTDSPHEPGCNCGESNECPTYAPGLPSETPEAPPAREPAEEPCPYRIDTRPHDGSYLLWRCDGDPMSCRRVIVGVFETKDEAYARLATLIRNDARQSTEPPPLPDGHGWSRVDNSTMVRTDGSLSVWRGPSDEGIERVVFHTQHMGGFAMPASVLRHLLGLTAPAADVQALEIVDALLRVYDRGPTWVDLKELRSLLTGKGAP